jgi:hypothetical protein
MNKDASTKRVLFMGVCIFFAKMQKYHAKTKTYLILLPWRKKAHKAKSNNLFLHINNY